MARKFGSKNHHGTGTRLYEIWKGMRKRCNCPYRKEYKDYGAKGIRVCAEWDEYPVFREWAMANGYSDDLTIDRIDPQKDYTPQNCMWITKSEQSSNKRNSIKITYNGETRTVSQWAEKYGFKRGRLYDLIRRGTNPQEALKMLI